MDALNLDPATGTAAVGRTRSKHAPEIITISCTSGFIIMAFEIMSGRILSPTFGSSIFVWGAVITVFMLALSFGYLIGGRISMNRPSLKRLAGLHILTGVLLLPVIFLDDPVLDLVFDSFDDQRTGALISCMLLFFLPAMAGGTVTPYAVNLLVHDERLAGFYAGVQYFFSTAFSAAGVLLTSFYFVLILEVDQILLLLGLVPIVVGSVCLVRALKERP